MILIIGGRYQGKLDYARARFGLMESDIFLCSAESDAIDLERRCVAYIDRWALGCVRRGSDPLEAVQANIARLRESAIIATDISCGVVPTDAGQRAWREACGRLSGFLASRADEVWRLFCGLPQRIK